MQKSYLQERRKYIRLNSVFPVEIYLPGTPADGKPQTIQAFTRDISLGGLCLSVNNPDKSLTSMVHDGGTFDVTINMLLSHRPIEAKVRAIWHDLKEIGRPTQLLIGVSDEKIDANDKNRIFSVANRMKWLPRAAVLSIMLLLSLLAASQYQRSALVKANQEFVERFHNIQETSDIYKASLDKVDIRYNAVMEESAKNKELIDSLTAELKNLKSTDVETLNMEKERLEESLKAALGEKSFLEEKINAMNKRKDKAVKIFNEVKSERRQLDEAAVRSMYGWITAHQNKRSGLVMSFEGDPGIADWAFTYDQALVAQVFLISGDVKRAQKVLGFFKNSTKREKTGFKNAYNAVNGLSVENIVHLGPNIWIAIAAIHYADKTGDKTYLTFAEDMAKWIISLKDADGGLAGGPGISWYSTEHNLDAYALFNMLWSMTSKDEYRKERDLTLKWIKDNTYSKSDGGMKRGKGDGTIATDTMAWAIAAIGPAELSKEGMDPEGIMKFAEEHCLVSTDFVSSGGDVINIKGFDFAKARNMARRGVVSSEWTAQMVTAFKVMANYYAALNDNEKANLYKDKADIYLNELYKMMISSPSPSGQGAGCLPYASQPNTDTGHGWRTPEGKQTGSLSGTSYAIFAKKGYNPLSRD
ncbi:MAG: PilZ domain-containing protein [Candidatus Omnitrophica bacterium]|nr:PilZ domain-containing protein [Candidatus Omnitrophota bacterium]